MDLFLLGNAFSLENSIQFTPLMGKNDKKEMRTKKREFPLLGGMCMFRREMRSKRESLPPK